MHDETSGSLSLKLRIGKCSRQDHCADREKNSKCEQLVYLCICQHLPELWHVPGCLAQPDWTELASLLNPIHYYPIQLTPWSHTHHLFSYTLKSPPPLHNCHSAPKDAPTSPGAQVFSRRKQTCHRIQSQETLELTGRYILVILTCNR